MYDLLILSMLSSRDMSGYKLAIVLGSTVVPRRKISNGVLYSVLNRMEKAGFIQKCRRECPEFKNLSYYRARP